jgi:hypothetical protein
MGKPGEHKVIAALYLILNFEHFSSSFQAGRLAKLDERTTKLLSQVGVSLK